MAWKPVNVMEQRFEFIVRRIKGEAVSELCWEYGVSRKTAHKWLRRFKEAGTVKSLADRSRRPHRSPSRTGVEYEERVLELRREYGWGGRKLTVLLAREGIGLSESTVNRIIKRHDLTESDERNRPAVKRFERESPNELWQMDFKGEWPISRGNVYPLSILDDHSRFAVGLYALRDRRLESVKRCCVAAFEEYGVPSGMLMDRGTPWWSTTNAHGLTRLAILFIKQGITLHYSGVRHPQTQGKVERFHRTMKRSIDRKGRPDTLGKCADRFRDFRHEYNKVRPHEALGMEVPASKYLKSEREYDPEPPEWEYPMGAVVKRLNTQGMLQWGNSRFFVSEALSGERVRIETLRNTLVVIFRHMIVREIEPETGRTTAVVLPVSASQV